MKILIGGAALVQLGSSRSTLDTDYLVNDTTSSAPFMKDEANNVDYINANGHPFFAEIFKIEEGNEVASPQSLLELKAFSLVHQKSFEVFFNALLGAEADVVWNRVFAFPRER